MTGQSESDSRLFFFSEAHFFFLGAPELYQSESERPFYFSRKKHIEKRRGEIKLLDHALLFSLLLSFFSPPVFLLSMCSHHCCRREREEKQILILPLCAAAAAAVTAAAAAEENKRRMNSFCWHNEHHSVG